jgi:hypothetical protein
MVARRDNARVLLCFFLPGAALLIQHAPHSHAGALQAGKLLLCLLSGVEKKSGGERKGEGGGHVWWSGGKGKFGADRRGS